VRLRGQRYDQALAVPRARHGDARGLRPRARRHRREEPEGRRPRRRSLQVDLHLDLRQGPHGPLLRRRHRRGQPGLRRGRPPPAASSLRVELRLLPVCKSASTPRLGRLHGPELQVVGSHGGISLGEDGPPAVDRGRRPGREPPGFTSPCPPTRCPPTPSSTRRPCTRALSICGSGGRGPNLRPGRALLVRAGKTLSDGSDVTVIANGLMVAPRARRPSWPSAAGSTSA
jgi:hypothetical protein